MVYCAVPFCRNHQCKPECELMSFHKFPTELRQRLRWTKSLNRGENWQPSRHSLVCSQHFTPEDFEPMGEFSIRIKLKKTAVPSIFPTEPGPGSSKVRKMKIPVLKDEFMPEVFRTLIKSKSVSEAALMENPVIVTLPGNFWAQLTFRVTHQFFNQILMSV